MYPSDHPPPHFHATYGEHEVLIRISDGSIYAGLLPRRALRLVRAWHALHIEELGQAWNQAAARQDPGTIDPLP
jgi:hypothetical protein